MTKTIITTYSILHRYREKLFIILVASILVALGSYFFLLQKAIVNIVEREKMAEEVSEKSRQVATLEADLFTMKNSITLDMARNKGFRDKSISAYISKKSVTAMASSDEL